MTKFLGEQLDRLEKSVAETYGERTNGKHAHPSPAETESD
jgi:hypothetical protein